MTFQIIGICSQQQQQQQQQQQTTTTTKTRKTELDFIIH
jgi:hypothetical protein